jgi:hypothetical protein
MPGPLICFRDRNKFPIDCAGYLSDAISTKELFSVPVRLANGEATLGYDARVALPTGDEARRAEVSELVRG